jgi:Tol biopolymer transport system component
MNRQQTLIRRLDLDRFDLLVIGLMLALVVAIGGVVLAGDQVGVYVVDDGYAPTGVARGAEPVRVRFSDDMDRASVEARFHLEPNVPGSITWTGQNILVFTPQRAFEAGQTYTVTIEAGARSSKRGSRLQDAVVWSFSVRLPYVAYLAPSDAYARNLYMTDLQTGDVYQLTQIEDGVEDYAVSPGGGAIAYTHNNPDGTADIWVLDLIGGTQRQITNCVDALCSAPAWKPDGTQIVYQRQDFNTGLDTGIGPARAWIVDLGSLQTALLFSDAQILGFEPRWSPDGARLAVYDAILPGIRVHDFASGSDVVIESLQGTSGHFSPDGTQLVYPVLVRGVLGEQFYTHLERVDFEAEERTRVSGPEETPVEDGYAVWSPQGDTLLVARRYLDERYTPGKQIYRVDVATGNAEPLVVDEAYNHSAMQWDTAGQRIVFQRFPLSAGGVRPEIWVYDVAANELAQVAGNAFLPQWVP